MNDVHTTEQLPVSFMLRVEDGQVLSLDIFGPPHKATKRVAQWIEKQVTAEMAQVGVMVDELPVNVWRAPEGVEFLPGQG